MKRLVLLLPFVVLCGRLLVDARADLTNAERGDRIVWLGRAARAWLPFGPSHTAREKLAELGRQGTPGAWSELRGAILATRWLLTPDRDLLDEANTALANERGIDVALLRDVPEPSRPLCVLALVGLVLFLFGSARALAGQRRLALVGAAGFALFVIGLHYA